MAVLFIFYTPFAANEKTDVYFGCYKKRFTRLPVS
jgi:hypothetical protein